MARTIGIFKKTLGTATGKTAAEINAASNKFNQGVGSDKIFSSGTPTVVGDKAISAQKALEDAILRGASPQGIADLVRARDALTPQAIAAKNYENASSSGFAPLGLLPGKDLIPSPKGILDTAGKTVQAVTAPIFNPVANEINKLLPKANSSATKVDLNQIVRDTIAKTHGGGGIGGGVGGGDGLFQHIPTPTGESDADREKRLFDELQAKTAAELETARKNYLTEEEANATASLKQYNDLLQPQLGRNIRLGADILGSRGLGSSGFEGSGAVQELVSKASQQSAEQAGMASLNQLINARSQHANLGLQAAQLPGIFGEAALNRSLGKTDIASEQAFQKYLADLGVSAAERAAATKANAEKRQGIGGLFGGIAGGLIGNYVAPGVGWGVGSTIGSNAGRIFG